MSLDLPNLKLYFWAAQLRAMVEWLLQNEETNWLELEKYSCATVPLEALPFLDKKTQSKFKIRNDWNKCTQRVWNMIRKKIGAPLEISRAMKISGLMNFKPKNLDYGLGGAKGLIMIHQMFDGEVLRSFRQLQDRFGLTNKDFHRYLQLRSYLMSHKEWSLLKKQPTPIEDLFINIIKEKTSIKVVSQIYKCLKLLMSGSTLDIKGKWELEMNVIIDDTCWEDVCEEGHKITSSPMWKEFNWKLKMRYFRTPTITSKFDRSKTNLCWRECHQIGDHTHIFWDCPKLGNYWGGIRKELFSILNIDLPLTPQFYIIGVLPKGRWEKKKLYLLRVLILIARKMITLSWLKPLPPTVLQWQERVKKVYFMEKITAHLHLKMDIFRIRWAPISEYLNLPM